MKAICNILSFVCLLSMFALAGCGSSDDGASSSNLTSDPAGVYEFEGTGWTLEANAGPDGGKDYWKNSQGLALGFWYFDANAKSARDLCEENYADTASLGDLTVLVAPESLGASGGYWWGWDSTFLSEDVYDAFFVKGTRGLMAELDGESLSEDQARRILESVRLR